MAGVPVFDAAAALRAAASAAIAVKEKETQEAAANAAYQEKLFQSQQAAARAERYATTEQARTAEDYAAKSEEFRRSQHLQNLMKREQLAQRGITSPTTGTIPQSEWGQVKAEQGAYEKGMKSWKERKLVDIGEQYGATTENINAAMRQAAIEKEAGQYNWSNYLRSVAPSAYAGGGEALLREVF